MLVICVEVVFVNNSEIKIVTIVNIVSKEIKYVGILCKRRRKRVTFESECLSIQLYDVVYIDDEYCHKW